jgi:hypothetical protein
VSEALAVEEIQVDNNIVETNTNEPFYRKYKIHLSVAAAVLVVGVGALAHYKNEQVKTELVKAIGEYQEGLVLIGGEMKYGTIDCSGIITTDCEIKEIKFSIMGQEQLSIGSLRLGDVEEFSEFKAFGNGESIDASIDIEADDVALPEAIIGQIISQNVSNAFQQNTLEKLKLINFALKGEVEGTQMNMKRLEIDQFRLDNAIMPFEFSMSAREVSSQTPDSMILDHFALTLENRAISDVTYGSVKSFVDTLPKEDKGLFLKEFGLNLSEMNDKEKAAKAINGAIAKRFEADLVNTSGVVEKDLIRTMIQMLKGEIDEITLSGKNQKELSMVQIQNALVQSAAMSDDKARTFMEDKFKIEVESD